MKRSLLPALLLSVVASLALAASAGAGTRHRDGGRSHGHGFGRHHAVFVQTNEPSGNRILVYRRAADGTLAPAGSYATGGKGAVQDGAVADTLASQGSLTYDRTHHLLFAVNAGSDTISSFLVRGTRLLLLQIVPSGGAFPTSVAVHRDLVYALDAGGSGTVQGFRVVFGLFLVPIRDGSRSLGLGNADTPNFLTSPGQVGFSPDGRQLVVTTKASTSAIDVFQVRRDGRLSDTATTNPSATPVPFGFVFDPAGRLVSAEAGGSHVTSYTLGPDGTLSNPQSLSDGQAALCWIVGAGGFYYASNTGSNTVSGYALDGSGTPSLLGQPVPTDAGPVDATSSGRFLYVQTGVGGTIDEYEVGSDGALSSIGQATAVAGMEGIAAS
jgi:hypothetical protein